MSKPESRPERKGHARPDAGSDRSLSPHHSEHAAAGDRLRSEAHFLRRAQAEHRSGSRDAGPATHAGQGERQSRSASGDPLETKREQGHRDVAPLKAVINNHEKAATAANKRGPELDARKSVKEHIDQGAMKKAEPAADKNVPAKERQASEDRSEGRDRVKETEHRSQAVEKIKVVYSDQSNDPAQRVSKADFRVKKDGTIEVVNDPDKNNKKEIVIEVERDQGQVTGPTEAQQKSIDELTRYVSDRHMKKRPDGTKDGVIEDHQGLVSDRVKGQVRTRPAPEQQLPERTRHQVENMRRFSGGGRGTLSSEQADSYFTPRDQVVPRRADESSQKWALKETVAGIINVDKARPYEAVDRVGDRGWGVGRYMLTYDMLMAWLEEIMGDPPDPAKLEKAVKAGKISPKMAAKLQSPQFKAFMEKLKSGDKPPTEAEIKEFLPKELQEQVAGDLIDKFSQQLKTSDGEIDAGKLTLAMMLGHVPSEEELAKPEYQAVKEAADRLYSISKARTDNPGQSLEWQDVNQRLLVAAQGSVGKAMWANAGWSHGLLEYGNLGCAASVSSVMKLAGVDDFRSASVTGLESQILKAGGYRVSNPQPGDIVIGLRDGGRAAGGSGHIGIVGENGTVYHNSSAKRHWVQAGLRNVFYSGRFDDVHYLRLPSQNA